jgi:hypothetical protein
VGTLAEGWRHFDMERQAGFEAVFLNHGSGARGNSTGAGPINIFVPICIGT